MFLKKSFMKNITLLLIIFIVLTCSCNFSNKSGFEKYQALLREEFKKIDTLHIDDAHKPKNIKYSEAIESPDLSLDIEFIKLETKPEALIGYVGNIMHDDGKIFICDNKYHSLYIFADDGHFIHRIHNVGNGPKEYNKLTDFTLDKKKKRIVLYDAQKKTYYYYKYDGTFIESKRFGLWFREFCITPAGNYLLYTNNGNRSGFRLFQTDSSGINITKKALPWNGYYKMNMYATPHIERYKDETLISYPFSNAIYIVKNNSIDCKYQLDFNGNEFRYDWENHPGYHNFQNLFKQSDKEFYYIGNFIENDEFALFPIETKEIRKDMTLAYNKKTGKTLKVKLKYPDSDLYINPQFTFSKKFAGSIYAYEIIEYELDKKYKELKDIHEDDNPCLVLFSIKNI